MLAENIYLSVAEAARELNVSERRVLQFINEGRLFATRFGKSWAIPRDALQRFKQVKRSPGTPGHRTATMTT